MFAIAIKKVQVSNRKSLRNHYKRRRAITFYASISWEKLIKYKKICNEFYSKFFCVVVMQKIKKKTEKMNEKFDMHNESEFNSIYRCFGFCSNDFQFYFLLCFVPFSSSLSHSHFCSFMLCFQYSKTKM